MNRFTRWIKKNILKVPVLSHDSAQIAEEREKVSSQISDEQIFVQTVKQAISVNDASDFEKIMFALSGLPDTYTDFPSAKEMFFEILAFLETQGELDKSTIDNFNKLLLDINNYEMLMEKLATM